MMTVVPPVSPAVSTLRRPVAVFLVAGILVFGLPLLVSCRLDQLLTAGPAPVVNLRPDTIGVAEAKPLPVTVTAGGQVQGSVPLTFESLEDQVSRAAGTEFPRTSRASAEIVVISPMLRNRAFWGVSCTEETVWRTVTVARARAVSTRASIVAGRPLLRAR